jgi:hypothetical protein
MPTSALTCGSSVAGLVVFEAFSMSLDVTCLTQPCNLRHTSRMKKEVAALLAVLVALALSACGTRVYPSAPADKIESSRAH